MPSVLFVKCWPIIVPALQGIMIIIWANAHNTFRTVLGRGSIILVIVVISSCYRVLKFYLYIFLIYVYPTIFAGFNHSQMLIKLNITLFPPLGLDFFQFDREQHEKSLSKPTRTMISQWQSQTIFMKKYSES